MAYQSLEKLFYKDSSADRYAHNTALAYERLNAESTFRTGIDTPAGELFLAVPHELLTLSENVMGTERRISVLLAGLPYVAQGALVRSLVVDEVVCTNELEGIGSTRKQISDLLENDLLAASSASPIPPTPSPAVPSPAPSTASSASPARRRFRELARLYLGLGDPDASDRLPKTPADVRAIYDLVMQGEDLANDAPDGTLFRKGRVDVVGAGQRTLHEGVYPESAIIEAVRRMLDIVNSEEMPPLLGTLVGHFVFEYAHPFYDGNGRTGRYLLALGLTRSLSALTALSLSRTIAESRSRYYRAFKEAESQLNHGELTMFALTMLEYVREAQRTLVDDLERKTALLSLMERAIAEVGVEGGVEGGVGVGVGVAPGSEAARASGALSGREPAIVSRLAQQRVFGAFPHVSLDGIAEAAGVGRQQTRKYLLELEEAGWVATVSRRPLRFALSEEACRRLGLAAGPTAGSMGPLEPA